MQTINQLLTEMDGFENNKGVVFIAATNRPGVLDDAVVRPGRFDRIIHLSHPNLDVCPASLSRLTLMCHSTWSSLMCHPEIQRMIRVWHDSSHLIVHACNAGGNAGWQIPQPCKTRPHAAAPWMCLAPPICCHRTQQHTCLN